MPRSKPTDQKTQNPEWYKKNREAHGDPTPVFVNYELSNDQRHELKEWRAAGHVTVSTALACFSEENYRLSFKEDTRGGGSVVFAATDDRNSANYGGILSGRGRTYETALLELWYKHEYMKRRWNFTNQQSKKFWED
jgi:hypothetical protein